jgi:putative addiction module killer protein
MEAVPRKTQNYRTMAGLEPFKEWLLHLSDLEAKVAIVKRLERVQLGNLGESEPVGGGVLELKLQVGPGYRVYLGQDGKVLIILLMGGDKHSQKEDIQLAKKYWADYRSRK